MNIENLPTDQEERKERGYYTQEGFPVDPENVYFRVNNQPYLLTNGDNGNRVMTKISLIELKEEESSYL